MTRMPARLSGAWARGGAGCVFALVALALTAGLDGWATGDRIDPALTLPFLMFGAAAAALVPGRGTPTAVIPNVVMVAVTASVLAGATMVLAIALAGWVPPEQMALIWVAAAIAFSLALVTRRWIARRSSAAARLALGLLATLVGGVIWAQVSHAMLDRAYAPAIHRDMPRQIALLTSLPLLWDGQGVDAVMQTGGADAPIRTILDRSVHLTPIDAITPALLGRNPILLLAHPRALPPQALVDIDAWIRGGGRTLVLADALSRWPSPHPLGDPRNPPITSLLTPLLTHWGLDLDIDVDGNPDVGPVTITPHGYRLHLSGTGRFSTTSPACRIIQDGRMADCRIGRGRAILIADADLLHHALWEGAGPLGLHPAYWSADTPRWLIDTLHMLGSGTTGPGSWLTPLWRRS